MTDHIHLDPEVLKQFQTGLARQIGSQQWTDLRTVQLGALIGTEQRVRVPENDRQYQNQNYYTSLDGSEVGKVINTVADFRYGRRVVIGYPPGDKARLHVYRVNVAQEIEPSAPDFGVLPHAGQHELINAGFTGGAFSGKVGEDIPRLDIRQLWNAQAMPWSGLIAYLAPGWVPTLYGRKYWAGAELADLTAQIPAGVGMALFCLVEIDNSLAVSYTYGPQFVAGMPEKMLWDYVPAGHKDRYQAGVICLRHGMTRITWGHLWSGFRVHAPTVAQVLGQVPTYNGRVMVYNGRVVYT